MTAKKAELEKRAGLKLRNALRRSSSGTAAGTAPDPADRRAQRERDRAAGLVAFAVKLPGDLVSELQVRAQSEQVPLAELAARLLRQSLRP